MKEGKGLEKEARAAQARELGEALARGERSALAQLEKLTENGAGLVRQAAVLAVGGAPKGGGLAARALDFLERIVGRGDEYLEQAAAVAAARLMQIHPRRARRVLHLLAQSPRASTRLSAARGAPGCPTAAGLGLLRYLVKDGEPQVRAGVAAALGEVAEPREKTASRLQSDEIVRLLQCLLGDGDEFVRCRAAEAIGKAAGLPGVTDLFGKICKHPDDAVRMGAAAALSQLPPDRAELHWQEVEALCIDANPVVRAQIAFSLALLWPVRRRACLERLLHLAEDEGIEVRVATALAFDRLLLGGNLSQGEKREITPALLRLAREKNLRVSAAAAPALGLFEEETEELLLSLAEKPAARAAAAAGLGRLVQRKPEMMLSLLRRLSRLPPAEADGRTGLSAVEEFAAHQERPEMRLFACAWLEALRSPASSLAWRNLAEAAKSFPASVVVRLAAALGAFAEYLRADEIQAFCSLADKPMPSCPDPAISAGLATLRSAARTMEPVASRSASPEGMEKARQQLRPLADLAGEIGEPEARALREVQARLEKWLERIGRPALSGPLEWRLLSRRAVKDASVTAAWLVANGSGGCVEEAVLSLIEPAGLGPVRVGRLEAGESRRIDLDLPVIGSVKNRLLFAGEIAWKGGRERIQGKIELLLRSGGKRGEIPNPYLPGKPLEPESALFYGRQGSLEFLARTLGGEGSGRIVILTGQRRSGKTSLLRRFAARYSHLFHCIYVDVQGLLVDSTPLLFYELSRRTTEALEEAGVVMERPQPGEAKIVEGYYLEEAVRRGRRPLVLILDEFDDLEAKVRCGLLPEGVFGHLRHLFQHTRVSFLLSGTHRLEELGKDYWSFLFNLGLYHHLGPLEEAAARALIVEPTAGVGIVCEDLAVEELLELSGGHPYLLQLACHQVVEGCAAQQRGWVSRGKVREAMAKLLEWGEAHFRYLWELAGGEGQDLLWRLSQGPITAGSWEERVVLEGLVSKHLARVSCPGKYCLSIGLVREWLKAAGRPQ